VPNPEKISTGSFPQADAGAFQALASHGDASLRKGERGLVARVGGFVVPKGIPGLWKNFAGHAIPTWERVHMGPQAAPKYSISERVAIFLNSVEEMHVSSGSAFNAGELAGSSFSRLGVAF
jgi:hypothetical protein